MGANAMILSSGLLQAVGSIQQAKAAEGAAKLNAQYAAEEAAQRAQEIEETGRRLNRRNVSRLTKSGVRNEGSPNFFMLQNDLDVARQAYRARRAGAIASNQFRNEAQSARTAGRLGAAGSLMSSIGRAALARDNPLLAALGER